MNASNYCKCIKIHLFGSSFLRGHFYDAKAESKVDIAPSLGVIGGINILLQQIFNNLICTLDGYYLFVSFSWPTFVALPLSQGWNWMHEIIYNVTPYWYSKMLTEDLSVESSIQRTLFLLSLREDPTRLQ